MRTPGTWKLFCCGLIAQGGYGTLYGPNIDADGNDTLGEGKIAGDEYLAYMKNAVQCVLEEDPPRPSARAKRLVATGTSSQIGILRKR